MAIKNIVRITTSDTKKTYEYPNEKGNPELWEVTIIINNIDRRNGHVVPQSYNYPKGKVHVTRKTLEDAGVLPKPMDTPTKEEPEETVEDLVIRLLEHVGYYPCQGDHL